MEYIIDLSLISGSIYTMNLLTGILYQ